MAHRLGAFLREITQGAGLVGEADTAGGDPPAGMVEQAGDGERGDGFAGTGFPDDGHRLPGLDREIETVDDLNRAVLAGEGDIQAADVQQGHGAVILSIGASSSSGGGSQWG